MTITADQLRTWCERIATLPSADARELVAALGIPGEIVTRVQAIEEEGQLDRLELELEPARAGLTRGDLDRALGPGRAAPPDSGDSAGGRFTLIYRIDPPGAPFGCEIAAAHAAEPAESTPVSAISLRRRPARAAAPPPRPEAPIAELADVLAQAAARLRQDGELKQRTEELRAEVAGLGQTLQAAGQGAVDDEGARKAAAAQIERLVDAVARTGAAASRAVAKQGPAVRQAVGAIDMSALTESLRRFAELIASGAPDAQARVKELIAQLEGAVGSSIGKLFTTDAERQKREDEERRAAIKRDVQASLDEIFRGKKKP